ncbi:tRNA 2-thiouridine(34) synthase MnmA [Campylobacter sp. RM13119]|uniref:tRNA-specific 2-thiouridylase MnmA n=1 Tax=Campylobacter californiensis TaxID=1032243 RepID=A0ABD4JGT1_9BACT|nr:tRNA 2-thiouridine(34) synthase MnmA [Campylobacter sp. RM13119]MBE2985706.1 tRNA 2-thiouridine(34) synthase MnmA [Campylobacter sp. RM12919]MBE2988774.1 tRNA 2-thiouridine(34) synthase MnmA [Campylobacter sp. RM12920]MBE3021754.1 tRNA 2-thiouridine(34) synthase MnmA [Campylobacter sp. 7477a]MBE3606218.1 tRNA 2-thiouridine(34) synthase MnmA [Campylobacter sp. RM13119]
MKIMVAMSGGVDSTMTAKILQEQGHEVQGCYMKLHTKPGYHEENIRKVKKVGEYLGIQVHILDLQDKFNEFVYDPFVKLYKEGKTPNPCALCNRFIKLGALLDFAKEQGCEKLATGHYVQVVDGLITQAKDPSKDQSYFLAQVPKEVLKDVVFPLGDKFKSDIKELAKSIDVLSEFGTQAESSEICFVEDTYIQVLEKHYNTNLPGNVVDKNGNIVGRHQGYMHYTIGKRRGFEIYGAHEPHFVLKINADKNEIVVGSKDDLAQKMVELENVNLFIDKDEFDSEVKIRYRSPKLEASVKINKEDKTAVLMLNQNALGVAQGQLCVMYDGDKVIASGFIK